MAVCNAQDETFDALVAEEAGIVDFYSTHCGPCRLLLPELLRIEAEMPFIRLVKVNTDHCPLVTERFQISAVPAVYLFKEGKLEEYHGFMRQDDIQQALAKLLYE